MKGVRNYLCGIVLFFAMVMACKMPVSAINSTEREAYEREISTILSGVKSSWSNEQKVIYIHDYLVTNTDYDLTYRGHRGYDALVNHSAVCEGYAMAFDDLVNRLGIPSVVISSDACNHAWNAVSLNGKWYYVDCTWDDPIGVNDSRYCKHENLLRNEAGMRSTDHSGNDWKIVRTGGKNIWVVNGNCTTIRGDRDDAHITIQGSAASSYNVVGKYKDSKYEKAKWRNAENIAVVFLDDAIGYENADNHTVYTYKNGKATKAIAVDTGSNYGWSGSSYIRNKANLAGKGNTLFIGFGDTLYRHKVGVKGATKVYSLNNEEKSIGNITDISVASGTLRYDVTASMSYGDTKPEVKSAEYISASKAAKMTKAEVKLKDSTTKTLEKGGSVTLKAKTSGVSNLTWTSDNMAVATVSNGKVTAKAAGSCWITASGDGASDSCMIIVTDPSQEEAKPQNASGKADSDWLKKFYSKAESGYIYISNYKGNDKELVIPATAVYEGKVYKTVVAGGILDRSNNTVEKISFEEGVILALGTRGSGILAAYHDAIKNIDLRGCVVQKKNNKSNVVTTIATYCPNLETVNMYGLDLADTQMRVAYECTKLKTVVLPKYASSLYNMIRFSSTINAEANPFRTYISDEYGTSDINFYNNDKFEKESSDVTLKKYPGKAKDGTKFTRNGITYKVSSNTTRPIVIVCKIKGSKADIPSSVLYKGVRYLVTGIDANSAKNNKTLKSVTIGSGVQTIGATAFANCAKLEKITVKSGVIDSVGKRAFYKTSSKVKLSFPVDCKSKYSEMWKAAGLSSKAQIK